jgi:N-acetylmuramoyl-L-alanine amidase
MGIKNLAALLVSGLIFASNADARIKVGIVPGHGPDKTYSAGETEWCEGKAGNESKIAYSISKRIESDLNNKDIGVLVTRDRENFDRSILKHMKYNFKEYGFNEKHIPYSLVLLGAADYMNTYNFDMIVNIHMDDAPGKNKGKMHGFSIYYSTTNARPEESLELAEFIRDELKKDFKPSNNQGQREINKCSGWILIGNHKIQLEIPSVLVECGYIDEEKFQREDIWDKIAEDISIGIKKYIKKSSRKD